MRIQQPAPKDKYVELAAKIAEIMPAVGSDRQRGGWYDVVERALRRGRASATASPGTTARRGGSRSRRSSPT